VTAKTVPLPEFPAVSRRPVYRVTRYNHTGIRVIPPRRLTMQAAHQGQPDVIADTSDGINPNAGVIVSVHGIRTTATAGNSGKGTVFAVNTDGSGLRSCTLFAGGSDGGHPWAGFIVSGNTLFRNRLFGRLFGPGHGVRRQTDGRVSPTCTVSRQTPSEPTAMSLPDSRIDSIEQHPVWDY